MIKDIKDFIKRCYDELAEIESSPIMTFVQWRRYENGDLNYRKWVGSIYAPNNPCSIVTYSSSWTARFKSGGVEKSEILSLFKTWRRKVYGFIFDIYYVKFLAEGITVACPTMFVVMLICSSIVEKDLRVYVTRKSYKKASSDYMVLFFDHERLLGYLSAWID